MSIDTTCSNFKERCLYSVTPGTGHSGFLSSHRYALVTLNLSTKASTTYCGTDHLWGLLLGVRILLCSFLPLFSCLSVCWNITKLKWKKATSPEQQFPPGELMQHNYCLLNSNNSLHPKVAPGRWVPNVQRCTGFHIGRLLTKLRNMNIIDIIWIIKE